VKKYKTINNCSLSEYLINEMGDFLDKINFKIERDFLIKYDKYKKQYYFSYDLTLNLTERG
jgi:hypothetical protein